MTRILVIEDEAAVRDNIQEILELEGFELFTAEDGLLGIQMAELEQPDLIICDVTMPELDGYKVLEQLRQSSTTAVIPFIFLTARADHLDFRQGMELGADDYLTKPFTPGELRRAVSTRLEKRAAVMEQYRLERERGQQLKHQAQENLNLAETQQELLSKIVTELRNPLSNINMAIQMLERASTQEERGRYVRILREECVREMALLNEVTRLQELLTPGNAKVLRQFNLLK